MTPTPPGPLPPNLNPRRGGRRRVPPILQMEATECGAACLAMILARFGRWVPLEELRVRCGVSRDGSKAASVLRAARELGLKAQGYRRQTGRIFDVPFPMIVFWNFNHFVVVEGIRGDRVYIVDPGEGPRTISRKEFDGSFTGVALGFEPGPDFRRGGSPPSVWRGLRRRLGAARAPLAFAIGATLLLVIPGLAIPTLSKVFVDDVLVHRHTSWMAPLLIGLGITAAMRGLLTWLQQYCLARLEIKLSLVTTAKFFQHIVTLPMTFFHQRYAGDLANRVMLNNTVAQLISGGFATNAIAVLTLSFYGAVMLSYDVLLAVAAFAMGGLNLIGLRLASTARENAQRRLLKEQGAIAGLSVSGVRMIETLKANGAEQDFFSRWTGIHANALGAQQRLGLYTNLLNIAPPALAGLNSALVLGLGGVRILEGALTIGGLVAFQSLAQSFSRPIEGLVQFGANLQTARGDIAKLDDVLNYEPDPRAVAAARESRPGRREPARGLVQLENVTFGYNRQEAPLVRDLNLTIAPGQRVALVGGSGSGKSTIARLACGILTPQSGVVRIDGRAVEDIRPSDFVAAMSFVDQDIHLFEGTVRDNICLWDRTVSSVALTRALRDAAIHDAIMSRPGKVESRVEEDGGNFSGGQRQRLEIARALVTDPAILVLDEATAALDTLTELEIDGRLRQRGCTCLIVAHRLSTIRDVDEIVVLDRGNIAERGTHDELIGQEGIYRDLITAG